MSQVSSDESELLQLDNSAYTVGWITALPHEAAASEAMLDRLHEPPKELNPRDTNEYTLGSITGPNGEHNLVIASLPAGLFGTISAATVAAQMLSSFPAIKFGLMVGIGGGIWSKKHDIRLGDVVVSQPDGNFGGVMLYGFGKETADGFETRGHLNSPPTELLKAVSKLKKIHIKHGSRLPEFLKSMQDSFPAMTKPDSGPGFVYQGANNDRLFKSDYNHQCSEASHQGSSENCDACDGAQEVQRTARNNENPTIHYGIIASGNVVMKDAEKRDLISKDCLCFDHQAAGLMQDFPCLVIRGICDYCDSHKSKQWQNYAAATAAAYAKELLRVTRPAVFNKTPSALEIMKGIKQG